MSNYATNKELECAIGVATSNLAAKKDLIALKAEVGKIDMNKVANVPTNLNSLTTKVDDLDLGKWKTVRIDFEKLGDVLDNQDV